MAAIAKIKIYTFLFLVAILTILLAWNLQSFDLKPGIPLPDMAGNSSGDAHPSLPDAGTTSVNTLSKAILGFFLIGCLFFIFFQVMKSASWNRRTMLKGILYIAAGSLVAGGFFYLLLRPTGPSDSGELFTPPQALSLSGPPLGAVPPFLLWIAWIGLAVVLALLLVWFFYRRNNSKPALDPVQFAVEEAVLAIAHGQDFKSAILRCYRQMSLVLEEEQGIELEMAMTAREFENLLEKRGLPPGPVHEITTLFESARYGNGSSSPEEETRALNCLNTIVQSCRAPGR